MPHRKYICRDCWNTYTKNNQRKKSATLEGYFSFALNSIKNNEMRNRYERDIDLQYLLELYEKQEGRCAISNIPMTWGFIEGYDKKDNIWNKRYRPPFNIAIDRVDNLGGYTKDNVVLLCNIVNFFKGNNTVAEVIETAKEIIKNEGRFDEVAKIVGIK